MSQSGPRQGLRGPLQTTWARRRGAGGPEALWGLQGRCTTHECELCHIYRREEGLEDPAAEVDGEGEPRPRSPLTSDADPAALVRAEGALLPPRRRTAIGG